ncbi:SPARC-related modular calcium-binding protein 1 [Dufourea novaeangliae]|uniref:SPARC-related modular calcium-binding protein 1 n=1 Tax=Dufourea novaeangliae TaxID=178035 RepID=A0A154PKV1_DUFNO|nr:SPARC-related modular calcium-binding protein 1 [Dufourea novaeangliae]
MSLGRCTTRADCVFQEECRKRIAECTMSDGASTPVCGSDGVTYSSQCRVISKQCQGMSILIKHTGPCPETPACFSARLTARPGARPVCRPDGTYAPVQCHEETGYCWCVTPQGRPLPDTSVRHQRPRCLKPGPRSAASTRSGQRRRSPSWKQRRQYSSKHRNTCDRAEKSKFNGNLIENFKIEYRRTNISTDGDKNVERVLSWKFVTLDKNGDGYLDRAEYKELRRLAKKAVRPKKCARTFARTCDLNRDLKLSRQEWGACLANDFTLMLECTVVKKIVRQGVNYNLPRVTTSGLPYFGTRRGSINKNFTKSHTYRASFEDNTGRSSSRSSSPASKSWHKLQASPGDRMSRAREGPPRLYVRLFLSLNPADERPEVPEAQRTRAMDQVLKGNPASVHSRPTFNDDPADTKEDSDANDCLTDRRSVLEDERQHSQEKFYVPECTPDGRYHRVQCYSGYCWCVYQDTGKPIPGTSSKDRTPNCNPVPTPSRPMKGCPEQKKQLFLRDLMDLMQKKMKASGTDSDETTTKWQASKEEQIATWHFVMLDKNKNKAKWKSFRTMVASNRQLQRCGKRLPRYCDINNDRRISMTEWLSCLNAQRPTPSDSTEKTSTSKPKRMGPNPLDQLLKNDDD